MSGPCDWRLGPPPPEPLVFAEREPEAEEPKQSDEEPRRTRTVRRTQK